MTPRPIVATRDCLISDDVSASKPIKREITCLSVLGDTDGDDELIKLS